jgi:hypothetical protein
VNPFVLLFAAALPAAPLALIAADTPGESPSPSTSASASASASAEGSAPISAAEQMLFVDPHLRSIKPPQTLVYRLQEPGVQGSARLDLSARADGKCCRAQARFDPADGSPPLPNVDDAQSNPVLLFFLEREVRGLQQRTKGQSAHFRRRIRVALADSATVAATTVRWRGADVPATMVSVAPFANDPYRARFEAEALTTYTFVLSAAVPGTVVQMRAISAPNKPASAVERTLTIDGAEVDLPKPPAAPASPAKT